MFVCGAATDKEGHGVSIDYRLRVHVCRRAQVHRNKCVHRQTDGPLILIRLVVRQPLSINDHRLLAKRKNKTRRHTMRTSVYCARYLS